ncbi:hypothetical protein AB4M04_01500 [Serratia quinivorans]|uniref:Uncharacterized protein n=1 Tax=Serratia quinivorans TaxID=137545 RepID=A0ABV3UDB9_9GAMM
MTQTLTTERMAEIAKLAIRLQQISSCAAVTSSGETVLHHTHVDEILSALHDVTAELLANREAQPVAFTSPAQLLKYPNEQKETYGQYSEKFCVPLYTAPPAPAVPEDIAEIIKRFQHQCNHLSEWHHIDEHSCKVDRRDLMIVTEFLSACRAAMLAQPVSQGYKLDGGENCWSCGKHFTYAQHSECDGYCPHCDSPVDLDDGEDHQSKVVPSEPTEEMISSAWREATGKCDHETIKRMYATMLAAAPEGGNGA